MYIGANSLQLSRQGLRPWSKSALFAATINKASKEGRIPNNNPSTISVMRVANRNNPRSNMKLAVTCATHVNDCFKILNLIQSSIARRGTLCISHILEISIVPILACGTPPRSRDSYFSLKVKNGSSGRCFHVLNGRNSHGFKWKFLSISVFLPISEASRLAPSQRALLKSFKVYPEQSQSSGATQSWVRDPPRHPRHILWLFDLRTYPKRRLMTRTRRLMTIRWILRPKRGSNTEDPRLANSNLYIKQEQNLWRSLEYPREITNEVNEAITSG